MKNNEYLSLQEIWLRQALGVCPYKPQVIDALFNDLKAFFARARSARTRDKSCAAAHLESIILGTPFLPVPKLPASTPLLLNELTSTQQTDLCQN